VFFSGGQAPGGHNVISGLFDALKKINPESELFGFIGGPSGVVHDHVEFLTEDKIALYRNQGGFDLIGSGRTKLETNAQFEKALHVCIKHKLDGLVIIGGDDSNTNAAFLAEYFLSKKASTVVVGVPKTIDGDLKNREIEISFGFDTACRVYSEIIGNIAKDAISAKKYYFFIKLMGRSASHVALECALQTRPNYTLIGEEILDKDKKLAEVVKDIALLIVERHKQGKDFGVILIPEGIIEFLPDIRALVSELNKIMALPEIASQMEKIETSEAKMEFVLWQLKGTIKDCFANLPQIMQEQLLLDRDPHGNVQVSKIETERLFISLVKKELDVLKIEGGYSGKFSPQPIFCGYEGRSSMPSFFDTHYCYALGHMAALLVSQKKSGYMAALQGLKKPVLEWQCRAIALNSMMQLEERKGKEKLVIKKALVDLKSHAYLEFCKKRKNWRFSDCYRQTGPIQFFGSSKITEQVPLSL